MASLYTWTDRFLRYSRGLFPPRWRLPLRLLVHGYSRAAEPELRYLKHLCTRFRTAVDVGANHGYYAYRMAHLFEHVYAFEANTQEDYDLWHLRRANIHVFSYGLSAQPEHLVLRIPICNGVPLSGWASATERALPFAEGFRDVPARVERLDDQPFVRERPIDLIKVDVEGCELDVLRGGEQVIRRDKPVLIIEDNAEQRESIAGWLTALGYRSHTVSSLLGRNLPSPNLVWIPEG